MEQPQSNQTNPKGTTEINELPTEAENRLFMLRALLSACLVVKFHSAGVLSCSTDMFFNAEAFTFHLS